jgi:hypothetical protein
VTSSPVSPDPASSTAPKMPSDVATTQCHPSRSCRSRRPSSPPTIGDVPMPTTVPTATPALLTPAKNSGW